MRRSIVLFEDSKCQYDTHMSKCHQCNHDSGHASYAFCTECGTEIEIATSDLPTLIDAQRSVKKKRPAKKSVEDENLTLRKEIERLRETSEVLFGATEEDARKRVSRILAVSGFERNHSGKVQKGFVNQDLDISYNTIYLRDRLDDFEFYRAEGANDIDQDQILFVAVYRAPVDLEKELADIRQLIAHCDERRVSVGFVIATNEDLRDHKQKVRDHFNEIRMTVPRPRRSHYRLEVWDQKELLKLEHKLKIKVQPKTPRRGAKMRRG